MITEKFEVTNIDYMEAESTRYADTNGINIFPLESGRIAVVQTPGCKLLAIVDTPNEAWQVFENAEPYKYVRTKTLARKNKQLIGELDLSKLGLG